MCSNAMDKNLNYKSKIIKLIYFNKLLLYRSAPDDRMVRIKII